MALIKYSGGVGAYSGKIGGTVYAHNRYGSYARTWKKPVDPSSALQVAARARLTAASEAWRGLSDAVRLGWEQYADATPMTNRLGETIYLSGQAMFARCQAFGAQLAVYTISGFPGTPGQAPQPNLAPGAFGLKVAGLGFTVSGGSWTDFSFLDGASDLLLIQISPPVSAGVTFHKGPWTTVLIDAGTVSGLANPTDPIVISGVALAASEIRFVRVRQMDSENRLGPAAISEPITVVA